MQDNVVSTMYTGVGAEQKVAQEVLTTLKEHPDSWTKVRYGTYRFYFLPYTPTYTYFWCR